MEKKKNKSKTNKVLIIILLIIAVTLVMFLTHKPNVKKSEEKEFTDERAKELVYGSYVYYVLSSGNIPKNEYEIYLNDVKYYGIDIKIKSLDEIEKIISDTFSKKYHSSLMIDIYGNPERNFTAEDGILYTNNVELDEKCKLEHINLDNYEIVKEDNTIELEFTTEFENKLIGSHVPVVYEEGKWKLNGIIEFCM